MYTTTQVIGTLSVASAIVGWVAFEVGRFIGLAQGFRASRLAADCKRLLRR